MSVGDARGPARACAAAGSSSCRASQPAGPGLLRVHVGRRGRLPVPAPQQRGRGHRPDGPGASPCRRILGALVAFGVVIGPAYALAMEREDGTLLRAKAMPERAARLRRRPAALPLARVVLVQRCCHPGAQPPAFDDLMTNGVGGLADAGRVHRPRASGHAADRHVIGVAGAEHAEGRHLGDAADHGPGRDLRHLLPDPGAVGLGPGRRPVFPMYWIGLGHALGVPAGGGGGARDQRSLAHLETVGVLGGWAVVGIARHPDRAAPDGPPQRARRSRRRASKRCSGSDATA